MTTEDEIDEEQVEPTVHPHDELSGGAKVIVEGKSEHTVQQSHRFAAPLAVRL